MFLVAKGIECRRYNANDMPFNRVCEQTHCDQKTPLV